MDMQKVMKGIIATAALDRSKYHLTLGKLISALAAMPDDAVVRFDHGASPGVLDSYREYYSDLAFESMGKPVTVDSLLVYARAALGCEYRGYKGGDYMMTQTTPLWNAEYGDCGLAIIGCHVDGDALILETKQLN